jgi:transmembrane sensor
MRQSASEIANEAALWVARVESDSFTQAEQAELEEWLAGDPRRRGAFLQAHAAWISIDQSIYDAREPERTCRFDKGLRRRSILVGAAAAMAASVAGGFLWLDMGTGYRTELGEVRSVPLSDGSTATINSASELTVRLAEHLREVDIASGEAWFRVAKDASRPFRVKAGKVLVQAVGTAFSVRRRSRGVDILVTEGVVEVWLSRAENRRVRVSAGQRAYAEDSAAVRIQPDQPSAVDRALAWRSGEIDLSAGETLAAAVEEFNRYNRRKLVLADARLGAQELDGVFRTNDPEGFARAIQASFDVPIDLTAPEVIRIGA